MNEHPNINVTGLFLLHREDAPYLWQERLCWPDSCGNKETDRTIGVYEERYGTEYRINVCRYCGGILFTSLFRCPSCSDYYLKDFVDDRWCLAYPLCWDCLSRMSPAPCSRHRSMADSNRPNREPLGLNPRKYSREELSDSIAGFFDD